MKITTELLKKYALNACTAQEREAVERWLADTDSDVPPISDEQWERANALMKTDIAKHVGTHHKTIVPMHKKWMRYSANEGTSAVGLFWKNYAKLNRNYLVIGGILSLLIPIANGVMTGDWLWTAWKTRSYVAYVDVFWLAVGLASLYLSFKVLKVKIDTDKPKPC